MRRDQVCILQKKGCVIKHIPLCINKSLDPVDLDDRLPPCRINVILMCLTLQRTLNV